MGYALHDLRNRATIMEVRVVASEDKPNVSITFGKTGFPQLLFEHGKCGLLEWAMEECPPSDGAQPLSDAEPEQHDPFAVPEFLVRKAVLGS